MSAAAVRFVGRSGELLELRAWLAAATAGHGRMAVLRAEAGVGKTRLAEELAALATAEGIPAVWGRCSADAGAPPLWPLRRVVAQLPAPSAVPFPTDADVGRSVDASEAARFARSVWFADAVVSAADPAGLLVVVEDLHWADTGAVVALAHLAAELGRSRALVVVTSRPTPVDSPPAPLAALVRRPGVEHRLLSGLDRHDIAAYLDAVADQAVDDRYVDLVHRQTAGNSLYVSAVARVLAERVPWGHYDPEAAHAALAGRPELVDLVREPMGRVSDRCRTTVELASVAGEEFDVVELCAASGQPLDAVVSSVDEAARAGLLTLPAGSPGTARFVHALVRDGVYDSVDGATRAGMHRALADAIEARGDGQARLRVLAGHLGRGARSPADHLRAGAAARRAGHAALADLASAEAAVHFRSAIHSLATAGGLPPADRAELLLDLASAEYRAGAIVGAAGHSVMAADLAEAEGRWDLLARAALLVDGVDPVDPQQSLDLCRRALAHVPDGELSVRAQLEARLAYAAAERGDMVRAEQTSATALALADRTGDPAALMAALRARHQALAGPRYVAERDRIGARTIDLAGRGEPLAALWGRLWRIDAAFETGDLVAVDRQLEALAITAAELRFPLARWHLARLRAAREAMVGRFAAADEQATTARGLADELDDPSVVALYLAFELVLRYVRGTAPPGDGEEDEIAAFLAAAGATGMPIVAASSAMATWTAGDPDEAARIARRLCADAPGWPVDGRWLPTVAILADVVADVADADGAAVLHPLLLPFAGLAVAGGAGTVACDGSVSRRLGRLAATRGHLGDAERHLRDAILDEERMGAVPFAALSRMYLAQVLHAQGGTARCAEATRTARTALSALTASDMPGRVQECEAVLAAVAAGTAPRSALTRREDEIVGLVADGLSNRDVAARLFVSERTVETHVSHVLAKIGGSSRTDIVVWALTGWPGPAGG